MRAPFYICLLTTAALGLCGVRDCLAGDVAQATNYVHRKVELLKADQSGSSLRGPLAQLQVPDEWRIQPEQSAPHDLFARGNVKVTGVDLPELGTVQVASLSERTVAMAHRFKSEALPVARLWQTNSALIGLGLNNKGKPGLWLTKKLP